MKNKIEVFVSEIENAVENNNLHRITISNRNDKKNDLSKILIKVVKIKETLNLSFTYKYSKKDITKNFEIKEGLKNITNLLVDFSEIKLFTSEQDFSLTIKSGKVKTSSSSATFTKPPQLNHDHKKQTFIDTKNSIYLQDLGVVSKDGIIKTDKYNKFRQINKFLEIFDGLLSKKAGGIETRKISVMDMGSGKGYLTFVIYDFLTNNKKVDSKVTGIEYRKDMVDMCNGIAEKSDLKNLSFVENTIEDQEVKDVDVLVALHACDTATDQAIYKGIKSGSEIIICAPCCHAQIQKQFNVTNGFSSFLKHGILKERQAEIVTDGIRALLLEAHGYETKVFEFISAENTAKNIIITGLKSDKKVDSESFYEKIKEIKDFYGIREHYLETLLSKMNCKK